MSDSEVQKKGRKRGGEGIDFREAEKYLTDPTRTLPQSSEAELGVLASYVLDPKEVSIVCGEKKVSSVFFHHPAHAVMFEVLRSLSEANKPVDFITLTQALRDRNALDSVGGAPFVTGLFTYLPTAANVNHYVDVLLEKHTLRQIIRVCTEYAARSYDEQGTVQTLLDEVEGRIFNIAQEQFQQKNFSMKDEVLAAVRAIDSYYDRKGALTGLSTGLRDLDAMTDGLHPGEMFVIAARPSMGKTALAMNIAESIAVDQGKAVAVFSLEMSTQQLVQRLVCSRARISLSRGTDGMASNRDMNEIGRAAMQLTAAPFFIDDTPGLSILELRAKCRRWKAQHDIQAIFIDYLQLLKSTSKRAQENRQVEIAEISSGVKALAKELSVPIVVLAQLNRNPESRTGDSKGRPRLSDLRESGSIEQDADVVALLTRPEYYEETKEGKEEVSGNALLIIAKQRNGPVGDVEMTFLKQYTRFENKAKESQREP
jgi:replicative DNA helicase